MDIFFKTNELFPHEFSDEIALALLFRVMVLRSTQEEVPLCHINKASFTKDGRSVKEREH